MALEAAAAVATSTSATMVHNFALMMVNWMGNEGATWCVRGEEGERRRDGDGSTRG